MSKKKRNKSANDSSTQTFNLEAWKVFGVCAFMLLALWIIYGQTLSHDFVNIDDQRYVYQNSNVSSGLTGENVRWAFNCGYASNWHPLTWISHMVDCQLYGLKAGGHHLTNLLLHAAVSILLFFLLCDLTGSLWRSAFVATVFAVHPLRVESVAWVAERKDVLSALFFMLTIQAYVRYVRLPSRGRYAMVAAFYACGLMAKPMLVTLPLVLLLLDYWPLGRVSNTTPPPATRPRKGQTFGGWLVRRFRCSLWLCFHPA